MDTMTSTLLKELIYSKHVVYLYPRKKIFSVDGYKQYKATPAIMRLWHEQLKIGS